MQPSGARGGSDLDIDSRPPAKLVVDSGRSHLRTAILVLGMHRSGTSALTGVFGKLGADVPKTLIGANRSNETGHWESEAVARLNDRILESAGTTWDDWSEFNPRWLRSPKVDQFREEAHRLIAEEFGRSGFFVLKDPRICRFPAFWIDILATFGVRPVVVLPIRNPLEVAASLEQRNQFDPAFAQLMWLRHVLDAEAGTRSLPRLFVKYDDLLTGWSGIAQKAERALDLAWPRMSERAAIEVEDFLSERLKHHSERRDRVVENALLSRWLRTTFDIAWRWAEAGEDEADIPTLEEVRSEFNEAGPAFARLVALGRMRAAQVSELQGALAGVQERLTKADAETAQRAEDNALLQKNLEAEASQRAELQTKLEAEASQRAELQTKLEAEASQRAELQTKLEAKASERDAVQKSLEAVQAEAEGHAREAKSLRKDLEDREKALSEMQDRVALELKDVQMSLQSMEGTVEEIGERSGAYSEAVAQLAQTKAALERWRADGQREAEKLVKGYREHVDYLLRESRRRDAAEAKLQRQLGAAEGRMKKLDVDLERLRAAASRDQRKREAAEARTKTLEDELEQLRAAGSSERQQRTTAEERARRLEDRVQALTEQLRYTRAAAARELGRAVTSLSAVSKLFFLPSVRMRRMKRKVRRAGIVDEAWYLDRYKDVAKAKADALEHYVAYGAAEGREPNSALAAPAVPAPGRNPADAGRART